MLRRRGSGSATLLFLTIACLLAAAGVITDSAVTIVGAMVVSPDFGPLAALAVGTVTRRGDLVRRGVVTLCLGYLVAIVATALLAVLAHSVGLLTPAHLADAATVDFVYQVGPRSLSVALLAGVAGMVALTSNKSRPLIGAFVGITWSDVEASTAGELPLAVSSGEVYRVTSSVSCDEAERSHHMGVGKSILGWPVIRQVRDGDLLGRGAAVTSRTTQEKTPRTVTADRIVDSVCPYCAVGCGQRIFVKDGQIVHIEGNPDSPISRGRLCPKGAASEQLVNVPSRVTTVRYRRPFGTEWEDLDLETATDMIADRFVDARRAYWQEQDEKGHKDLHRTMGIAFLGGATLDNEENYLIKKLFTAAGAIQIENQARI